MRHGDPVTIVTANRDAARLAGPGERPADLLVTRHAGGSADGLEARHAGGPPAELLATCDCPAGYGLASCHPFNQSLYLR